MTPVSSAAARVLVCFAVREEARGFAPPAKPVTDVLMTGIGVRKASRALQSYLASHHPSLVLTCGFAGGLNPRHRLGQVLIDDTAGGPFRGRIRDMDVFPGTFVHSDRVVVTAREKAVLHEVSSADAVEMESSTIATLCQQHGIPVIVLRVISDTATEDLPLDFNRYSNLDGSLSMGRLLLGIAASPSIIPDLMAFQGRLKQASKSLGAVLGRFLSSSDLF